MNNQNLSPRATPDKPKDGVDIVTDGKKDSFDNVAIGTCPSYTCPPPCLGRQARPAPLTGWDGLDGSRCIPSGQGKEVATKWKAKSL